jgi:hypothetical protein
VQRKRLFDGVAVRMDWGHRRVINFHVSGQVFRAQKKKRGLSENEVLDLIELALLDTLFSA